MNNLTFNDINFTPVRQNNQIWLTSVELAKALGYSRSDKVTELYNRNADEFAPNMTQVIDFSDNLELGVSEKTGNLVHKVRIFSLRGCHLIAMFARTKVAKEFRKWVLDILDKEVGEPVQVNPRAIKINDAQAYQIQKAIKQKCQHNSVHYQTIYHALYDEFGVKSYKDILAVDFDKALVFIQRFRLQDDIHYQIMLAHIQANQQAIIALKEAECLLDWALGKVQNILSVNEALAKSSSTRNSQLS